MSANARILLIEDDSIIAEALKHVLAEESFEVTHEARADRGLGRVEAGSFDVVLSDLKMPGMNGLELVREMHRRHPRIPIVLMTAHGTAETAIEATRLGAFDYLIKPFEMAELIRVMERAVSNSRLAGTPVSLGEAIPSRDAIVGSSRPMQELYKEVGRIADKPVTVLIRGETGTGKELIARALWQFGDRSSGPFVAINCAAIPEGLLESDLFGHERGAFTGAVMRRIGRFEQAHQGTLFLDEVGDLSHSTQVKLLRVLQERRIRRLGGREEIAVDVRVIAATHCDLESAVQEGGFREDLYYRLGGVSLTLPPLRDRRDDIPELANYLLKRHARDFGIETVYLQPGAEEALVTHEWPGNVRQLENTLRKALLACRGFPITREHVIEAMAAPGDRTSRAEAPLAALVADLLEAAKRGEPGGALDRLVQMGEREMIAQAIDAAQGNQAKAARWVGISRLTMREKLRQFGLKPGDDP